MWDDGEGEYGDTLEQAIGLVNAIATTLAIPRATLQVNAIARELVTGSPIG